MTPAQARSALDQIRGYIDAVEKVEDQTLTVQAAKIAEAAERRMVALVLALASDTPIPVAMLRAFASHSQFYKWNREGSLSVTKHNRKSCVKPSEFFPFWATLKK